MKNDFKHSDKHLQDKFKDFRMEAPEGAWVGIENQIAEQSRSRGRFFFFWLILLFIGLTGGAVSTYFYFNSHESNQGNLANSAISKNTSDKNTQSTTGTKENLSNTKTSATDQDFNAGDYSNEESENYSLTSTSDASSGTADGEGNKTFKPGGNSNTTSKFEANSGKTQKNSSNRSIKNSTLGTTGTNDTRDTSTGTNVNPNALLLASEHEASNDAVAPSESNDTSSPENQGKSSSDIGVDRLKIRGYGPVAPINPSLYDTPRNFNDDFKPMGIWSLEAGIDLASTNYIFNVAGDTQNLESFLNNSYTRSVSRGGFLRANYQPFRYTSFQTGLEFNQNRASQKYTNVSSTTTLQYDTVGFVFDTVTQQQIPIIDSSFVTTENKTVLSSNSIVSQISIPIGIMFHIPVGLRSEIGINLSGLMNIRAHSNGEVLVDPNGNILPTSDVFRNVNFSARGAVRYSYLLNEHISVYAEPYFGIGLTNRSNSSLPFTSRLRNSGIRAGFRYSF